MLSHPRTPVDALVGNGGGIVRLANEQGLIARIANKHGLPPATLSATSARSTVIDGAPREWVLGAPGFVCLLVEKLTLANKTAGSSIDCGTEQEAASGSLVVLTVDAKGDELIQGVLPTGVQEAQVKTRTGSLPVTMHGNLFAMRAHGARRLAFRLKGVSRSMELPRAPKT